LKNPLFLYARRAKPAQQGLGETRHIWVLLAVLVPIFLSHPIGAEPTKEIRRILILNEVGASYPGIRIINEDQTEQTQILESGIPSFSTSSRTAFERCEASELFAGASAVLYEQ
jgi:hypothetical protein